MSKGLLARKLGMTQLFTEQGTVVPVTVLEADSCHVVQVKTAGHRRLRGGASSVSGNASRAAPTSRRPVTSSAAGTPPLATSPRSATRAAPRWAPGCRCRSSRPGSGSTSPASLGQGFRRAAQAAQLPPRPGDPRLAQHQTGRIDRFDRCRSRLQGAEHGRPPGRGRARPSSDSRWCASTPSATCCWSAALFPGIGSPWSWSATASAAERWGHEHGPGRRPHRREPGGARASRDRLRRDPPRHRDAPGAAAAAGQRPPGHPRHARPAPRCRRWRKPYRQKGTGRARQGSIRAPHYAGGGTVSRAHPARHSRCRASSDGWPCAAPSASRPRRARSPSSTGSELEEPQDQGGDWVPSGARGRTPGARGAWLHHDALEMSARKPSRGPARPGRQHLACATCSPPTRW